jgi:putative transcriptional regulator
MAICIYLDEMLKSRKMTSKELCGYIGITEANLSILRSGKAKGVRFGTLNKICYYLQCDVGEILRFDGQLEEESDEIEIRREDRDE